MTSLVGQHPIWMQCKSLLNTPCHIFITGPPGSGKTTLIKELLQSYATDAGKGSPELWGEESNDECLILSPEQDRGIQTIRGQVSLFIRQMAAPSVNGVQAWRWVIIDDVDTFPQISQQALRRPMESYSHITRFIFVGNSVEDLIPALQSRCIHINMAPMNPIFYKNEFLSIVQFPQEHCLTDEMWSWILNISQNNTADMMRILKLVRDTVQTLDIPITIRLIQTLCSAPYYIDFIPLLNGLTGGDIVACTKQLIHIWKRGYTFEDTLESFQSIHALFGTPSLKDNSIIHIFLVNAWIAYCKGNTHILALQNVLYRTLTEKSPSQSIPYPVST